MCDSRTVFKFVWFNFWRRRTLAFLAHCMHNWLTNSITLITLESPAQIQCVSLNIYVYGWARLTDATRNYPCSRRKKKKKNKTKTEIKPTQLEKKKRGLGQIIEPLKALQWSAKVPTVVTDSEVRKVAPCKDTFSWRGLGWGFGLGLGLSLR